MNKKSNKKLVAGLIALITLVIIGVTCSGFLDNFKVGMKFLGISFGVSLGLVLLLFIMKYIAKGADKLVGEGRTFNDRAIVVFSILILVSLTCGGFVKNFTMGIVFLIVSIVFVAITFLLMYGINSKKGEIKKVILAERTNGEKMFILLTALILVSLTCGGFIQNFKAGILFLIVSIISALALYLIVIEAKEENSAIGKVIRVKTTFNQKMIILLSTIIMVSLTCGGFLKNLKAGIVFLIISMLFTTSMLMLVLGVKSKHKIYDKIAGFETSLNEKMIILLTTMVMVSITSGGFLYNFKVGMLFLIISITFSSLVLAGVISVKPRVNIFKMRARIQNLGKREAIRAFGMIFACVIVVFNLGGTLAYFTAQTDKKPIENLEIKYTKLQSSGGGTGESGPETGDGETTEEDYDGIVVYFDQTKMCAGRLFLEFNSSDSESSYGEGGTKYKSYMVSKPNEFMEKLNQNGIWYEFKIPSSMFTNNYLYMKIYRWDNLRNGAKTEEETYYVLDGNWDSKLNNKVRNSFRFKKSENIKEVYISPQNSITDNGVISVYNSSYYKTSDGIYHYMNGNQYNIN